MILSKVGGGTIGCGNDDTVGCDEQDKSFFRKWKKFIYPNNGQINRIKNKNPGRNQLQDDALVFVYLHYKVYRIHILIMITITHLKELEKLSSICEFVYTRSFHLNFVQFTKWQV